MKPIEPGCMAIVINSACKENIGKIVTVGNYIGTYKTKEFILEDTDQWEVDKLMFLVNANNYRGVEGVSFTQSERNLERIDTDELPQEITETKSIEA